MRKLSLSVFALLFAMPAVAATDSGTHGGELYLAVRRIGLELSKTDVGHPEQYANSPVAALSATSQEFIKGILDSVLEYNRDRLKWDNGLFMEYGKTTLKPYNEPRTTDENADKILLSSDLTYECWEFSGFKFGPTVRGAYDTQFKDDADAPRQNILRASAGLSLFDHPIFKSLYLVGVYEYDFTYAGHQTNKSAAEAGWRLEYDVREGVKLSTNGYYREYLSYSDYVGTDLERDLSVVGRMDTNLWGNFTMGPYVQYRRAKAREAENYGSNLMIGLSFTYINRFGLITSKSAE